MLNDHCGRKIFPNTASYGNGLFDNLRKSSKSDYPGLKVDIRDIYTINFQGNIITSIEDYAH